MSEKKNTTDIDPSQIDPSAIEEGKTYRVPFGGVEGVAKMMNAMDGPMRSKLMDEIADKNPELLVQILKQMFTFDDLIHINDNGIQALLKEVPTKTLAMALRKVPENIETHLFKNLSGRAADHIREERDSLGPQKISTVEKAQQDMIEIARRLETEGKLAVIRNPSKGII